MRLRRPLLPPLTLSALLAMGTAAILVTWLVTHRGSGLAKPLAVGPTAATTTTTVPHVSSLGPLELTASALRARVALLAGPVYWLGPEPGRRYELRRATDGNVYLRYLPPGVPAGASRKLRTVGTYPLPNAYAATQAIAAEPGAVHQSLADGWLAVYLPSRPTSIYLARAGLAYQIEVFDPSAAAARSLVVSGRLRQVGP